MGKKKSIKIAVKKYTEITDTMQLKDIKLDEEAYITNEGGKQYLVEVWA